MSDPSESEAVGYKQPPNKTQFQPGQSGNPRGRPKRSKLDMSNILNNALNAKVVVTNLGTTRTGLEAFAQTTVDRVLQGDAKGIPALMKLFDKAKAFKHQTVVVKQGNKSERMSKGEALIKMLMSMAHQGDRRAINAMIDLTEKIGRIDNTESKFGARKYSFMLVPGVATSKEEWQREIAKRPQTPAYGKASAASPPRRIVVPPRTARSPPKQNVPTPELVSEIVAPSLPIEIVPAEVPTYDNRAATCRMIDRQIRDKKYLQAPRD